MFDEEVVRVGAPTRGELHFGHYRLAGPNGPLRAADRVIDLPRKPLALLWTLATRAGEVVTKDELLAAVWPHVVVTEGAIAASLRDLRRALGDDARRPRFIATAHRIGYRFIAQVSSQASPPEPTPRATGSAAPQRDFVGRDTERAVLQEALARALTGQRQLVFVTGEAGIGKSRLVDAFVSSLPQVPDAEGANDLHVGYGQCIELYGAGEPYLPILEAVTRLCRQPGGQRLLALLRQHAPTWLTQLPGLADAREPAAPPHTTGVNAVQRMLREMAEAIDAAAADHPLVLVFEDMHWSDRSTVDWLAMLARRRERARLLVVATCRPVELIVNEHPLKQVKQELVARAAAREITLGCLAPDDVQAYIEQRLQHQPMVRDLAAVVYRRSQGHPLFMVHMADELQRGADAAPTLDEHALPCGISELIEAQLGRLAPAQLAVLEAASVAGAEFAAASVAAALQETTEAVERRLETLARRQQFIEARGLAEWHDGCVSGRYGFRHDLYREGLYRRLGAARRAHLHALIGARLATAWGPRAPEIAAELALHFENARDAGRAAQHGAEAGVKALSRCAYREALAHADKGLAMLAAHAIGTGGDAAELRLRLIQGAALLATRGYGAPEVEATYTRALALGVGLDDREAIGPALSGLYNLYLTRAAFARVRAIADQVLGIVERRPDPVLSMLAHNIHGTALLFAGQPAASLHHVDQTLALYDAQAHRLLAVTYGEDPAIACHHYAALAQWLTGRPEAAARHLHDGFELALRLAQPFGLAQMLWMQAVIGLDDGDSERVDHTTLRLITLCVDHGFPLWLSGGQILRGAALAGRGRFDEGRALTDEGLQAWRDAGTLLTLPHALAIAARVQALGGCLDQALRLLDQALATAHQTGERWYEAELHRLQGELTLNLPNAGAAERQRAQASFERAIEVARQQQARLLEDRACASLRRVQGLSSRARPAPTPRPDPGSPTAADRSRPP